MSCVQFVTGILLVYAKQTIIKQYRLRKKFYEIGPRFWKIQLSKVLNQPLPSKILLDPLNKNKGFRRTEGQNNHCLSLGQLFQFVSKSKQLGVVWDRSGGLRPPAAQKVAGVRVLDN